MYLQVAIESCFPEHASLPDHSEWLLMRSSAWLNKCEGHFLAKVTCNANGILIPLQNVLAPQKLPAWMFCIPCIFYSHNLSGLHISTHLCSDVPACMHVLYATSPDVSAASRAHFSQDSMARRSLMWWSQRWKSYRERKGGGGEWAGREREGREKEGMRWDGGSEEEEGKSVEAGKWRQGERERKWEGEETGGQERVRSGMEQVGMDNYS